MNNCLGCCRYPFCEKMENPQGWCNDYKSKIEKAIHEEHVKALNK